MIVLVDFKMYIVSYNSVQNGLVYFYMSVYIHVCNVCMQCDDVHQNETLINY